MQSPSLFSKSRDCKFKMAALSWSNLSHKKGPWIGNEINEILYSIYIKDATKEARCISFPSFDTPLLLLNLWTKFKSPLRQWESIGTYPLFACLFSLSSSVKVDLTWQMLINDDGICWKEKKIITGSDFLVVVDDDGCLCFLQKKEEKSLIISQGFLHHYLKTKKK